MSFTPLGPGAQSQQRAGPEEVPALVASLVAKKLPSGPGQLRVCMKLHKVLSVLLARNMPNPGNLSLCKGTIQLSDLSFLGQPRSLLCVPREPGLSEVPTLA